MNESAGWDGFLGTRASLMLDVIVLAMLVVLPVMAWSIYQVRYRRRYALHKQVQLGLAAVLLVTVVFFEVDIRLHGWRARAADSPFYGQAGEWGLVYMSLLVHLVFAVSTLLLWGYVIATAWKRFPSPPSPNEHSRNHIFWARVAAADMTLTTFTGWIFYYLAFVA